MAFHYNPKIVTDGLMVCIDSANPKCYSGTGTSATDLSGNGYSVGINNGTAFSTDYKGVWRFDGVNDTVSVGNTSYPSTVADPFTIETAIYIPTGADWWVNNSSSGTAIVGRGGYSGSIGMRRYGTTTIGFWIRPINNNRGVDFTAAYDNWYILTGTFDGTNNSAGSKFYVNGNLEGTNTVSEATSTAWDNSPWYLGGGVAFGGVSGEHGQGDIPYFRLYNRVLSAEEAKQNFNATRKRFGL